MRGIGGAPSSAALTASMESACGADRSSVTGGRIAVSLSSGGT